MLLYTYEFHEDPTQQPNALLKPTKKNQPKIQLDAQTNITSTAALAAPACCWKGVPV